MNVKPISTNEIFDKFDFTMPGLENIKQSFENRNFKKACDELHKYFHQKIFIKNPMEDWGNDAINTESYFKEAENALKHIFHTYKAFPPYDYGEDINWNASPYNEWEWPAGMHRHNWADPILRIYRLTSDEKYARGWLDLTLDWIENWKWLLLGKSDPDTSSEPRI